MCIAIPLGKRDGRHGTRLGRFLRARPSRITVLAALGMLSSGLRLASFPDSWPCGVLLLLHAAALPLFGLLLERLPTRCGRSEIGYLRYGTIGLTALLSALSCLTGGAPGALLGALFLTLTWHLAARSLAWQLVWCRAVLPSGLRRLPRLLTAGALLPLPVALSTVADVPVLSVLSVCLAGIPVGLLTVSLFRDRAALS